MTYQSEYELEIQLIKQLEAQGYTKVSIGDEDALKATSEKCYLNITKKN